MCIAPLGFVDRLIGLVHFDAKNSPRPSLDARAVAASRLRRSSFIHVDTDDEDHEDTRCDAEQEDG